jgi:hypothetical protein
MDAKFHRHARAQGIEAVENRQSSIEGFSVERARLDVSLLFVSLSCAAFIPYGWVMSLGNSPLPAALVLLFIMDLCIVAAFQPLTALIIDINPQSPAAATATVKLFAVF